RAVTAQADGGPYADHRGGAEHAVGDLQRDGQDVLAGERVDPGPLESVKSAFGVGEERVAAYAGEQPDRAGLDGPGGGAEPDRKGRGEHLAGRLGTVGVGA